MSNLLSKGIVNSTGMTVLNTPAQQDFIQTPYPTQYFIDYHATVGRTPYGNLPQPNTAYAPQAPGGLSQGQGPFDSTVPDSLLPTIEPSFEMEDLGLLRTGATGLPQYSEDTRVTNASNLPNGAFQLTNSGLPYDSYTGDMVHRLFHMWQQSDCSRADATADNPSGCLNDLYPFVGVARNDGSGGNSMGFYNVSTGARASVKALGRRIYAQRQLSPAGDGRHHGAAHHDRYRRRSPHGILFRGKRRRPRRASPIPIPRRARTSHSRSTRIGPTALTLRSPAFRPS